MEPTITPTELASITGISDPYASQIVNGKRPWTMPLAIAVYRSRGLKFGPITAATDNEIDVLARFVGERAA